MGTAAKFGLPGSLDAGRQVLDCWIGSGHQQATWDTLAGFGVDTNKNIRGALLCFEATQSLLQKGYGIDVCAPSVLTPEYWVHPAGIIIEDLILGRDRIQERWVKVLRVGPTDRILMSSGGAENDVNTLWSNPGSPGTCTTHKHIENYAKRKLYGYLAISAVPAIVNLEGTADVNSAWNNTQIASTATIAVGGGGYNVGDLLTLVGGSPNITAIARVQTVSAGAVTSVSFLAGGGSRRGYYSAVPGNPVATTSAPGAGCTLNVTWLTIDSLPWFDQENLAGSGVPGGIPTLKAGKVFVAHCPIGDPLPATSPDLPSWASTFRPGYVQIGGISSR